MSVDTWHRGEYVISTDTSLIDIDAVHSFLTEAYWSRGVPRTVVQRAIEHSLCFGLYTAESQAGFARVITDQASFAYVCDVFVLSQHRGQGLGVWLMDVVTGHPDLQGLRRWVLFTRDAHELYRRVGFTSLPDPNRCMEKTDPDVYLRGVER